MVEYDDGRTYDFGAALKIAQNWLDVNVATRESDFTDVENRSIFCGTWNVNAKRQEGDLHSWILPSNQKVADIYAIGFQEIVDLNAMNVAIDGSKTQQRSQFWQEQIQYCLDSTKKKFIMVSSKALVGLLLCVFVEESLVNNKLIDDVRSSQLGVGLMGMMGNKGGVSIRLHVFDTSICFVCSHLAAHRENVAGRNSDFKNIYEKSCFTKSFVNDSLSNEKKASEICAMLVRPLHGANRTRFSDLQIYDHEIVFWLGDLNYRIDEDLPTSEVITRAQGDFSSLIEKDQLNIERSRGNVFQGFSEGELRFAPTYKYQPGTDDYDQRPEKKIRAPAWCDRILWKTSGNYSNSIELLSYQRSNLLPSDHKPVYAMFNCQLHKVVKSKENEIFQELSTKLRYWENDSIPLIEVSSNTIDFESVKYEVSQASQITLTNSGNTFAIWRFIPKIEDQRLCKRWITLDSSSGLLLPGESKTITVNVRVDMRTAQLINSCKESLNDVLVLRVEKGHDFYLGVAGEYERSCYGVSLNELVTTFQPIRQTRLPVSFIEVDAEDDESTLQSAAMNNKEDRLSDTDVLNKMSIPKELWRMVDALWTGNALRERDLFSMRVDCDEVYLVREALDCGTEFPTCSPHAIAEALTTFLMALPDPIVKSELIPPSTLEPQQLRLVCRRILEVLPPLNYNVLVYFISFLREVLAQNDYNRTTSTMLGALCVKCLTRLAPYDDSPFMVSSLDSGDGSSKYQTKLMAAVQIMSYFLTTSDI